MKTIPQVIITTTVLIAVARFESIASMPIFASIDVIVANKNESIANTIHIIITPNTKINIILLPEVAVVKQLLFCFKSFT